MSNHPSIQIFKISNGESIFEPFVESIPRKLQKPVVYVLDMLETPFVKIGSTSNPKSRISSYSTQSPYSVKCTFLICPYEGLSHVDVELAAHNIVSEFRHSGEWFRCSSFDAISAVINAHAALYKAAS